MEITTDRFGYSHPGSRGQELRFREIPERSIRGKQIKYLSCYDDAEIQKRIGDMAAPGKVKDGAWAGRI